MNLFVFFVLPLATILLAIVLQKILRSPILVAITFFAIYLIVAFVSFSDSLAEAIIAAIIYTIIAYITAVIVRFIKRCLCMNQNSLCQTFTNNSICRNTSQNRFGCGCGCGDDNDGTSENNNLLTISCSCGNGSQRNDLLTVDSRCLANDIGNSNSDIGLDDDTVTTMAGSNMQNQPQVKIRPVALGNNIVNRNMQRRVYRRW